MFVGSPVGSATTISLSQSIAMPTPAIAKNQAVARRGTRANAGEAPRDVWSRTLLLFAPSHLILLL